LSFETSSPKVSLCLFFLSISGGLSGFEASPVPGEVSLFFFAFAFYDKAANEKFPMTVVIGFPLVSNLLHYFAIGFLSISEDTDCRFVSFTSSFSFASNCPLFT
tara:strand:- start:57 stop:368 length:312 start_codon:yes stop_codon:yes gene_type:complete